MRDKYHSRKWSEDEVLAKKIFKHEVSIWTNGEAYQSPVHTPSSEKTFWAYQGSCQRVQKWGANQDKITIKKNGVSVIVDTSKGQNKIMMFCLKAKRYEPEGQEATTNLPEEKNYGNDKK